MSNLDYFPTINEVDCSRGAPMGRGVWLELPFKGLAVAFRVPLDPGGYDPGNAYWGTPNNLFCITDGQKFRVFLRADTLQLAIDQACKDYSQLAGANIAPLGLDGDEDLVTLRVKHALDGVIFEERMSRDKAFWKSAHFTLQGGAPRFADTGGCTLSASEGPLTFTIDNEVTK